MDISAFYKAYQIWFELKRPKDVWKTLGKLTEEVGEVAEGLFAFDGSKTKIRKLAKKGQTPKDSLKEEIADVMIVAMNLASVVDISHEELFEQMRLKSVNRVQDILGEKDVRCGRCS